MIKKGKDTIFIILVVGFLCILNLAIVFKVPLILQIFGLTALCIVPGYLICLLSGLKVPDPHEIFLYWFGLSIIFDLFFGLGLNTLLPVFGNRTPLSSVNFQIGYSVIILILTSLIVYKDRVPAITPQPVKLHRIEKIFLMFGLIILIFFEIGIYMLNMGFTNLILILAILLIPLLLLFCIIYNDDTLKRIFPFIIFLIGTSLLLIQATKTNYILGIDAHEEFFLFMNTLNNSVWIADPTILLSSALSVSLLPTVFERFLSLDPQLLFKLLFPFLFSVTPLIIYVTVKKVFNELLAVFAACFFIFQGYFIHATSLPRTVAAVFFLALAVMTIQNTEMTNAKKYVLLLLFSAGAILSHYTTSIIFLFIIILAYALDLVIVRIEKRNENRLINFPFIIFFSSLLFFWNQQVINIVFSYGLEFTLFRKNIFVDMANNDLGTYLASELTYIPPPTILLKLINYSRVALYALIGVGLFVAFYCRLRKDKMRTPTALCNSNKTNGTLISMACIACILLFCGLFAPVLFFGYDTSRMSALLFVILPVFLIIGVHTLVPTAVWERILPVSKNFFHPFQNFCIAHRKKIVAGILLILLVPQLLVATNLSNQLDAGPYSLLLNSPKFSKDIDPILQDPEKFLYIFDQDAAALQWFKSHSENRARIFSDAYGNKKITTFVNRPSSLYQSSILNLPESETNNAYIFLTFANGYFASFRDFNGIEADISSVESMLNQKNKIFANGAVLYY